MKKATSIILSMLLICTLFVSMFIPASAAEYKDNENQESIDTKASVVFPDIRDEGSNGGTTYYEIIDLTVAKTYEFICTKSTNTSFNLSDLPDTAKYIVIQGTLNNSEGNDNMKAGICYYSFWSGVYVPVFVESPVEDGVKFQKKGLIEDELSSNTAYYLYAKNVDQVGYMSGEVTAYYTES